MTPCTFHPHVQPYLDGDLSEAQAHVFREHLVGCAECAAELATFASVFAALDETPLLAPRPELGERILDRVLPSRARRRRWVRALGWGYAGALAGSLAAFAAWVAQPSGQAIVSGLSAGAAKRVIEVALFVFQSLAAALINLSAASKAAMTTLERFAPFARALGSVLEQSAVLGTLLAAAVACAALLWWMRPRDPSAPKEVRHVVLGF